MRQKRLTSPNRLAELTGHDPNVNDAL